MIKKVMIAVVIVVLVGGGFAFGLLDPLGLIGAADAAEAEGAPVETEVAEPLPENAVLTVALSTGERVVNLADPDDFRYLKTEIVIELILPLEEAKEVQPGESYHEKLEEITDELGPNLYAMDDAITSILSSKESSSLMTAQGKRALRNELKERLEKLTHHYLIAHVYLPTFIIQ